jgi:hypothetical protein
MQKLFSADVDSTVVLVAANAELPSAPALTAPTPKIAEIALRGWSAYEIWRSRIRLRTGVMSPFLPQA